MPQGRHKVPFSGKAKRQQLKEKKLKQQVKGDNLAKKTSKNYLVKRRDDDSDEDDKDVLAVNQQPTHGSKKNVNRYNLKFYRETDSEIQKRKEDARKTIEPVDEELLEINIDDYFLPELSFPIRPPWDFHLSKSQLDANEHRYFNEYLKKIEEKFNFSELSYFELNLETWRQLWRVLEISDIILLITDIRFPALMFPPSLYTYVTEHLEKEFIVVLNKIDLAPSSVVVAWRDYLKSKFPQVHIVMFTSYPSYNLVHNEFSKTGGMQKRRRKGKMRMAAEGAQKLLDACKDLVKGQVDLSSWQDKIKEEMNIEYEVGDEDVEVGETVTLKAQDTSFYSGERFANGVLTIGCVGQPNVGKSSLMNAIMGKKVVSVSRTPGHTKHFQTIFLTRNVRLCDCPGLVFPSKVPKSLQILMGSFPIAQVREPYSTIQFLAERIDLVSLLKIEHPELDEEWSAMDICDGWAKKRGYYTSRAARLDTYRAANHLLRLALEGKIPICMRPPGYTASKAKWETHADLPVVEWIQAASKGSGGVPQPASAVILSDEDSDDSAGTSTRGASSIKSSDYLHSAGDSDDEEPQDEDDDDDDDDDDDNTIPRNKFDLLKNLN